MKLGCSHFLVSWGWCLFSVTTMAGMGRAFQEQCHILGDVWEAEASLLNFPFDLVLGEQ